MRRWTSLAALFLLCAAGGPRAFAHDGNPDGLYEQMRACLAQARLKAPCVAVDRTRGFVVIKDDNPAKSKAWLIVPDVEVTGIEDPKALRRPVVDFWTYGWDIGRRLIDKPAQDIGLAINSKEGRTQNLLHIHISCVNFHLRDALAKARIGSHWATKPFVSFHGRSYNARKVSSLETSPFVVLRELPEAQKDMARQSIALIGAADGGFFLLQDQTEPGAPADAEDLLDETCR